MPQTKSYRIMQVVPSLNTGGVERGTLEMVKALKDAGHEPHVVTSGGYLIERVTALGGRVHILPVHSKNPITIWRNAQRLKKIVRDNKIDLVHARSRALAYSCKWAAKACKVPFVTTFHGLYGAGWWLKRLYNRIMTKGDVVIAISKFIAEHIQKTYRLPLKKIRIIPRGVDDVSFDPHKVSKPRVAQLANDWRLPEGRPIILHPARLTRWKGQHFLLKVLSKMLDQDWFLVLLGPTQSERYLKDLMQQVHELGLNDRVRFAADCRDMPAAYVLAQVVVSPSQEPEAFGRTIIEAQAMGRPVIASKHGGAMETIQHKKTGWLCGVKDEADWTYALTAALSMTDKQRQEFAERARAVILQNNTTKHMCDATMAVYKELLK